eukprot:4917209-Prymnesium_polylepis.1
MPYARSALYGTSAFGRRSRCWLRDALPEVLRPGQATPQAIELPRFSDHACPACSSERPAAYNPSIAVAPSTLCPRCAYVVAVRVDQMHQCDGARAAARGSRRRRFAGTALVVLDAQLRLLSWTWLLNDVLPQVEDGDGWTRPLRAKAAAPWVGAPQSRQVRDVRLFHFAGRLWLTSHSHNTPFAVSLLHI